MNSVNLYVIPTIMNSLLPITSLVLCGQYKLLLPLLILTLVNESLVTPAPTPPTKAERIIQLMYRQYHTFRLARAASTLQKWFKFQVTSINSHPLRYWLTP